MLFEKRIQLKITKTIILYVCRDGIFGYGIFAKILALHIPTISMPVKHAVHMYWKWIKTFALMVGQTVYASIYRHFWKSHIHT